VVIADIHTLGLQNAKSLMLSSAFDWDLNDETRAWSKRFIEKTQKVPTMIHAGTHGAVMHYLKAVEAAGTLDGPTVAAKMREMPVNDFMAKKEAHATSRDEHASEYKYYAADLPEPYL